MTCEYLNMFPGMDTREGVDFDSVNHGFPQDFTNIQYHAKKAHWAGKCCHKVEKKELTVGFFCQSEKCRSKVDNSTLELHKNNKILVRPVSRCSTERDTMTPATHIARPIPNQLLGQVRLYLGRSDADFDNTSVNSCLVWNTEPLFSVSLLKQRLCPLKSVLLQRRYCAIQERRVKVVLKILRVY